MAWLTVRDLSRLPVHSRRPYLCGESLKVIQGRSSLGDAPNAERSPWVNPDMDPQCGRGIATALRPVLGYGASAEEVREPRLVTVLRIANPDQNPS